jgi:hypothetical protein
LGSDAVVACPSGVLGLEESDSSAPCFADATELAFADGAASGFAPAAPDVGDDAGEPDDRPSSADAIAALLAIAAPIPNATANPPTLPMKRPYVYGVVATGRILPPGVC